MDAVTKKVVAGAAICAVSVKAVFFLIDAVAPPSYDRALAQAHQESIPGTADAGPGPEQLAALLKGADPSDLFEPTAAGSAENAPSCHTGKIEMAAGLRPELDGHPYVALRIDGDSYIQVMNADRAYLVQHDYQMVTATEYATIPDDAERQLKQALSNLNSCEQRSLYLSAITSEQAAQ